MSLYCSQKHLAQFCSKSQNSIHSDLVNSYSLL